MRYSSSHPPGSPPSDEHERVPARSLRQPFYHLRLCWSYFIPLGRIGRPCGHRRLAETLLTRNNRERPLPVLALHSEPPRHPREGTPARSPPARPPTSPSTEPEASVGRKRGHQRTKSV